LARFNAVHDNQVFNPWKCLLLHRLHAPREEFVANGGGDYRN
jgi:hypothetical protein